MAVPNGSCFPSSGYIWVTTGTLLRKTYDIFEGTEQIQQLLISRAISGLRIE